jgi:methionine sulfoxide reductase heme-binding subunit
MTSKYRLSTPAMMGIAATAATAVFLFAILHWGWNEDGATRAARYTARISFYWFIAAWSISSLARVWPGGWRLTLMRRRRALGLGFAASHSVHLVALLTAIVGFGHPSNLISIIGGGVGYAIVLAMAATSNDRAVKAIGAKRWQQLHRFGGYFLIGIFIFDYAGSFGSRPYAATFALLLIGTVILVKLWVLTPSYRQNSQSATQGK